MSSFCHYTTYFFENDLTTDMKCIMQLQSADVAPVHSFSKNTVKMSDFNLHNNDTSNSITYNLSLSLQEQLKLSNKKNISQDEANKLNLMPKKESNFRLETSTVEVHSPNTSKNNFKNCKNPNLKGKVKLIDNENTNSINEFMSSTDKDNCLKSNSIKNLDKNYGKPLINDSSFCNGFIPAKPISLYSTSSSSRPESVASSHSKSIPSIDSSDSNLSLDPRLSSKEKKIYAPSLQSASFSSSLLSDCENLINTKECVKSKDWENKESNSGISVSLFSPEKCLSSPSVEGDIDVKYMNYQNENEMEPIMKLIQKDLSEPYSIYTYRYFIHNWPKLCFLAVVNSEIIGAIVCKLDVHKKVTVRGYIAMLAVDQRFRKRKIGSNLVQLAIQEMISDNADEVVLETEITNKSALQLYENLGFVRDKRLFRYYLNGVDALRLKLWVK